MKKKHLYSAIALGVVVAVLWLLLPKKDMCADTVRGYKESADASLSAIRSGYDSLSAKLKREASIEVPPIRDLDAAKFSALRACDVQCQLLTRCLRFVVFKAPSAACPKEYSDLQETQKRAEQMLERLSNVKGKIDAAAQQAPAIAQAAAEVRELELTSGATGTRLAQAQMKQETLEADMMAKVEQIAAELAELQLTE
ncbi:hypothetical protein MUU77_17350 [Pseudoxanthomonas sp. F37]|uniref:hypothetical protein n=1 Tax=Pseudoxanthomonas sp. F37 TaxID=2932492 RepID=UPI001FD37BEB|nr:hypothetical protein [Pseudoxanthomonas sp. F37]UOV08546.1 hypothetical protein MUU77_17350 [Pseudoxanthomonas sp. F37]